MSPSPDSVSQERWSQRHPRSRETTESLRERLASCRAPGAQQESPPETPATPVESIQGESLVKEEDIKEEVLEETALPESLVKVECVKQEVKAEGEEEIAELAELCRGKWA